MGPIELLTHVLFLKKLKYVQTNDFQTDLFGLIAIILIAYK